MKLKLSHIPLLALLGVIVALLLYPFLNGARSTKALDAKSGAGDELRIDIFSPITSFNSGDNIPSSWTFLYPFIYNSLICFDYEGNIYPGIAEKWEYSDDFREWRIFLNRDVRFHNGRRLTAKDALFSVRDALKKKPEVAEIVEQLGSPNDYEIFFRLKSPSLQFFYELSMIDILPAPDGSKPPALPIGAGPFKCQGFDARGRLILTAFDDYYAGKPRINRIVFNYVPDSELIWYRLMLGETDAAFRVPVKKHTLGDGKHFHIVNYAETFVDAIAYNNSNELFRNSSVRKALTMAIDREYLIRTYLNTDASPAIGYFSPEAKPDDPDVKPLAYDPDAALALLKACGWEDSNHDGYLDRNGKTFEFQLLIPDGDNVGAKIAREIQLFFSEIGVVAHVRSMPMPAMVRECLQTGKWEAALLGLNNVRSGARVKSMWRSDPKGSMNFVNYSNSRIDRLLEEVDHTRNWADLRALYGEIDAILRDDQPVSFLYQRKSFGVFANRIQGVDWDEADAPHELLRQLAKTYLGKQ